MIPLRMVILIHEDDHHTLSDLLARIFLQIMACTPYNLKSSVGDHFRDTLTFLHFEGHILV